MPKYYSNKVGEVRDTFGVGPHVSNMIPPYFFYLHHEFLVGVTIHCLIMKSYYNFNLL
jgi:hypothetical protein